MTTTLSDIDEILKTLYEDSVPDLGIKKYRTWQILPKKTNFTGKNKSVSLQYARSKGISHTFSTARTRAAASRFVEFLVTRGQDYGVIQIDGETLDAARDAGSKIDYLKRESENMFKRMAHRFNRNLFRNHGMAIARIVSGGGTTTITVTDPMDLLWLEVGDTIVTSDTDGTSGSVDNNPTTITAIDRTAGTLTAAAAWNGGGGFSDNDYIFMQGDFGLGFRGLASWLPSTAPTSGDSFFGVDRSTDPLRLAGQRHVAVAGDGTLANFLGRALTEHTVQGGEGSVIVINSVHWRQLEQQLSSKVRYGVVPIQTSKGAMRDEAGALVGFKSIKIVGDSEEADVIAEPDLPRYDGYILDLESVCWDGLGEAPKYLDYRGYGGGGEQGWLRIGDEDAIEGRVGGRGQFWCDAPGKNSRLTFAAGTVV